MRKVEESNPVRERTPRFQVSLPTNECYLPILPPINGVLNYCTESGIIDTESVIIESITTVESFVVVSTVDDLVQLTNITDNTATRKKIFFIF